MNAKRTLVVVTLLLALAGCRTTSRTPSDAEIAKNVFGLPADAKPVRGENFVGLISDTGAYSHRTDSRTFVFLDGTRRGANEFFTGSDAELMERASAVMQRLGIPQQEIAARRILQEHGQSAQWDRAAKRIVSMSGVDDGKRWATLTRQIEGIPVFNSRAVVTLNPRGGIGYAEVHWPEIPREVVADAKRLQTLVREGWKAPQQPDATVESVDVGIIHSPPAARVMDIAAAIRVIYKPNDPRISKKPVQYFDRSGKPLAAPRNFRQSTEVPKQGRPGKP